MTDGLDQALVNAVLALLAADAGLTVLDGYVPNGTARPYVLVYSYIERPADAPSNDVGGLSRTFSGRFVCHAVGDTAIAARAVAQRVRTQLLDKRPLIAGMSCALIRQESVLQPVRDETTGPLVMDSITTYSLTATT